MIAERTPQQHYACKMMMSLIINIGESLRKSKTITFIMSRDKLSSLPTLTSSAPDDAGRIQV